MEGAGAAAEEERVTGASREAASGWIRLLRCCAGVEAREPFLKLGCCLLVTRGTGGFDSAFGDFSGFHAAVYACEGIG